MNTFHNNWDNFIPAIQFAYRSTPADNSIGFSPFFMLYGREAVLPIQGDKKKGNPQIVG